MGFSKITENHTLTKLVVAQVEELLSKMWYAIFSGINFLNSLLLVFRFPLQLICRKFSFSLPNAVNILASSQSNQIVAKYVGSKTEINSFHEIEKKLNELPIVVSER